MGGGGGFTFSELEGIKALFVLRGIGEWVQLVPAAVRGIGCQCSDGAHGCLILTIAGALL